MGDNPNRYPSNPDEFFQYRRSWLEDADAVTIAQNEHGQWGVFVKIDGWYSSERDARYVLRGLKQALRWALRGMPR